MSDHLDNIKTAREWIRETDEMFACRGKAPELPIKSINTLNNFLWGLHRKTLTIIGARPGNCKSVMAGQLAWDMAKQGFKVYFMSLEMPVPRIIERMFCMEFLVDNGLLLRGALGIDPVINDKYLKFKDMLRVSKLVLSDMIGRTSNDIDAIEKAFTMHPDVLIIDHLNEISGGDSKYIAIEKYVTRVRELAIRRNCSVLLCCQVNRSSRSDDEKLPQLHQLKGSGAAEEKADNVILLHYPRMYSDAANTNEIQMFISKNRYGSTGYGKLHIFPQFSRISDDGNIMNEQKTEWEE